MTMRRLTLFVAIWGLLPVSPGLAQARIGLALSGGAARGLAHVGVLKVLEAAGIPIDAVAGTSMGSVVGGLHAVGYTAGQLDTIFTTADWRGLLTDPVRRRDLPVERKVTEERYLLTLPIYRGGVHLPRSVVAGQGISQLLTGLTWSAHSVQDFRKLPIPFVAVATDIETGHAVVLDHGFLPDAIRASTAFPSVFSPVEIDGRVLIDGGVIRNLPAEDARALGADFLICSDVTDPLEPRDSIFSFVDVLVQAVSFRVWDSETTQRKLCDVLITPDVRAFSTFGFDRARELMARGEAAARAALPELEAALARAQRSRATRPRLVAPDSTFVSTIQFDRPGGLPRGFLDRALGLSLPGWVSRRRLDRAIARLYATGLFENVRYRLDGPALTVLLRERSAGRFAIDLRYDSRYKASVLLSTMLGAAGAGLSRQVDVRLGQQLQVGFGVSQPVGGGKTVTLAGDADYARSPFDLYAQGRRVAQARVDLGTLTASIARSFGAAAAVSARGKVEDARWVEEVSAVDSGAIVRAFGTASGLIAVDTYDRGLFPRRGVAFRALSEWGTRLVGSGGPFSHQFADFQGYVPLTSRVSVWGGATVGASGGTPPPHYEFFVGGANTYYMFPDRDIAFVGFHTQALRGRHVQKVELGAQWEFVPDGFTRIRWNAGTVLDRWTWDPARYVDGVSVELGAKTVAGRLDISASWTAHMTWPIIELDLGHPF